MGVRVKRSPMPRRRATPRRRKPARRCSWSNRCPTRQLRVRVSDEEWYYIKHGRIVADKLVGDFVKARYRRCLECGTTEDLEWAHLHSRGMRWIQYDPENSVALCRGHHFRFTNDSAAWSVWVEVRFPGLWTTLLHREIAGLRSGASVDVAEVIRNFRGRAAA